MFVFAFNRYYTSNMAIFLMRFLAVQFSRLHTCCIYSIHKVKSAIKKNDKKTHYFNGFQIKFCDSILVYCNWWLYYNVNVFSYVYVIYVIYVHVLYTTFLSELCMDKPHDLPGTITKGRFNYEYSVLNIPKYNVLVYYSK